MASFYIYESMQISPNFSRVSIVSSVNPTSWNPSYERAVKYGKHLRHKNVHYRFIITNLLK